MNIKEAISRINRLDAAEYTVKIFTHEADLKDLVIKEINCEDVVFDDGQSCYEVNFTDIKQIKKDDFDCYSIYI